MLLEHLVDGILDDSRLFGEVSGQAVHFILDGLELGHGEGATHLSLLCIPETLIKLQLELLNHVLIDLHEALKFFLLFSKCLVLSDIVLVNERWQLEFSDISLLDGLGVIQKHGDCHQFNYGFHYFLS